MKTLTWTRDGKWYRSTDRRFTILPKGFARSGWVLHDETQPDNYMPCVFLRSAKKKAEQIASGRVAHEVHL